MVRFALILFCGLAVAQDDPALEKRVRDLSSELRCLVCQNQTLADSNAPLALDLRNQVREQLKSGKSERDVIDFLVARYGDFVLYRPPVNSGLEGKRLVPATRTLRFPKESRIQNSDFRSIGPQAMGSGCDMELFIASVG